MLYTQQNSAAARPAAAQTGDQVRHIGRCYRIRPRSPITRTAAAAAVSGQAERADQRGTLLLFLDSADVQQWRKWAPTGMIYGFTTNPLILDRDRVPCNLESIRQLYVQAKDLGAQELQVQAWGPTAQHMEQCALQLLDLAPDDYLTIKLPCTSAGLEAATALTRQRPTCRITITGVYHQHQVLACLGVGADYMAPYLGRMSDQTSEEAAMEAITGMVEAVHNTCSDMRVLVASIRHPQQMADLAAQGCDTFTFSPAVMEQLCYSSSTAAAVEEFDAAVQRNS